MRSYEISYTVGAVLSARNVGLACEALVGSEVGGRLVVVTLE